MLKIMFLACPLVGGQGSSIGTLSLTQLLRNAQRDFVFKHISEDAG